MYNTRNKNTMNFKKVVKEESMEVQNRIFGKRGHLSNIAAAAGLSVIALISGASPASADLRS